MADIREKVGPACLSSDLSAGVHEVDIDRVGALGRAAAKTALGAAITRWIGAMELASYGEVVTILSGMIIDEFGTERDLAYRLAIQACREFGDWACLECGGRGEVISGSGVHFGCPACNGSKLRHYSDQARADALRLSLAAFHGPVQGRGQSNAKHLVWALDRLHRYDHEARGVVHAQLADDPNLLTP